MEGEFSSAIVVALIGGVFSLGGKWLEIQYQERKKSVRVGPVPTPPSSESPSPDIHNQEMQISRGIVNGRVIIDIGIILMLTALAGFVIGLAAQGSTVNELIGAIGIANLIFSIVGFTISGVRIEKNRWQHLIKVALGLWIVSGIINVGFMGFAFSDWFLGVAFVLLAMVIGGGISFLFKR